MHFWENWLKIPTGCALTLVQPLMVLLQIRSITGEVAASLDTTSFGSEEGPTGLAVKQRLKEGLGVSRFRQKLLVEDHVVEDAATWSSLGSPDEMLLVLLEFTDEASEQLLDGALQGDLAAVKSCLELPQEPNCQDSHGGTAVYTASRRGDVATVDMLLEAGADMNLKSMNGTPLMAAAAAGHKEVVQRLLAANARVGLSASGVTPVHAASARGHTEILQMLLDARGDANAENSNRATPLHLAAEGGHCQLLQYLLNLGVSKDARNLVGATALHIAATKGHADAVTCLAKAGLALTTRNQVNATALHIAAERGHAAVLAAMLQHLQFGATQDTAEPAEGSQSENLLEMLDARNQQGATALHIAAQEGNLSAVECLLAAGIDKDAVNNCDATALHLAAGRGLTDVVRCLVDSRANLNLRSQSGSIPLLVAVESRNREVVQCLLQAGSDNNSQNLRGETAHSLALRHGLEDVAQVLQDVA